MIPTLLYKLIYCFGVICRFVIGSVSWLIKEIVKAFVKILIGVLVLGAVYFFFLREFLNLSLFL